MIDDLHGPKRVLAHLARFDGSYLTLRRDSRHRISPRYGAGREIRPRGDLGAHVLRAHPILTQTGGARASAAGAAGSCEFTSVSRSRCPRKGETRTQPPSGSHTSSSVKSSIWPAGWDGRWGELQVARAPLIMPGQQTAGGEQQLLARDRSPRPSASDSGDRRDGSCARRGAETNDGEDRLRLVELERPPA
jgi:hypothetical protein